MSLEDNVFGKGKDIILDGEDYNSMLKDVGKEIITSDGLIEKNPYEYFKAIVVQADFSNSDDECMNVVHLLNKFILNENDFVLPYFTEHKGLDLASRCLCGLSFFYEAISRPLRQGAPRPSYYRSVGKGVLKRYNMDSVSSHFEQWEHFLREYFPR